MCSRSYHGFLPWYLCRCWCTQGLTPLTGNEWIHFSLVWPLALAPHTSWLYTTVSRQVISTKMWTTGPMDPWINILVWFDHLHSLHHIMVVHITTFRQSCGQTGPVVRAWMLGLDVDGKTGDPWIHFSLVWKLLLTRHHGGTPPHLGSNMLQTTGPDAWMPGWDVDGKRRDQWIYIRFRIVLCLALAPLPSWWYTIAFRHSAVDNWAGSCERLMPSLDVKGKTRDPWIHFSLVWALCTIHHGGTLVHCLPSNCGQPGGLWGVCCFAGNFPKIWVNYFLDDCNIGYIIKPLKKQLWLWAERFNALDVDAELTTKPFMNIIYICTKKHNNSLIKCANSWCWWHHSLHHKRMARLSVDVRNKHLICGSCAPIMWGAGPCIIASRFHSPARAMSARGLTDDWLSETESVRVLPTGLNDSSPHPRAINLLSFLQLFLQVRTWKLQCFFFFVTFKKKTKKSKVAPQSVKRRERYWLCINFQTENKMITHAETYSNVKSILRSINGKVELTTL
jgi:hypothetical protein